MLTLDEVMNARERYNFRPTYASVGQLNQARMTKSKNYRATAIFTVTAALFGGSRASVAQPAIVSLTTGNFEIQTLSPSDPLPVDYPPLIFFELINRSAEDIDVGYLTNADFDIEITAPTGKTVRTPLAKDMKNGIIPRYGLAPGQGKWFAAGIDRLPVGTYGVRILPAASNGGETGGRSMRTVISTPVPPQPATIRIDAGPATRDKWLADTRQRLEHFDFYIARWALRENVGPLHDQLLDMLADPTSKRSAFAAHAFRSVWRPSPDQALDRALTRALVANEALPMSQRTEEIDGALMNLVQNEPRPEYLDTVIRWSRPNGSRSRDMALLALQAYRTEPEAVEAVAAMLDDPNNGEFAARLLCDWRLDERALPVLEECAFMTEGRFSQPYIYWHLIIKYGRHPHAVAAIHRGLADPRPAIVAEAKAALTKLPPATQPTSATPPSQLLP
ncbi:MAG TPA: hypothetical protein VF624_16010 [Tepidisphaeraceae bacterium]|jgi:hypothetical protein